MPKVSKRRQKGATAISVRHSIEPPPVDAATPRRGARRTSTPLDGAASNADEADVDTGEPQYLPDSPTIESVVEDSAEASVEDTMLVDAVALAHASGSVDVDEDAPIRKRGILSQTSAFASQASPASQPKRVRFASSHVDVDGAASSAEVTTTSDADSTLSQFCDEHELCVADIVADLPLALPPLPSWISKVGDKDVPWRLDYNVERTAATLMIGGVVINLMIARLDQDADHGDGAADQVPASHRPRAPQC